MKEDHRSYRRNISSCEKKAWKNMLQIAVRFAVKNWIAQFRASHENERRIRVTFCPF